jgi:hypothetical protein
MSQETIKSLDTLIETLQGLRQEVSEGKAHVDVHLDFLAKEGLKELVEGFESQIGDAYMRLLFRVNRRIVRDLVSSP